MRNFILKEKTSAGSETESEVDNEVQDLDEKGETYSKSGVDIVEEGAVIEEIWKLLPKTFKVNPNVKFLPAMAHYGGIVDIGMPDKYLVVAVDFFDQSVWHQYSCLFRVAIQINDYAQ